MPTSEGTLREFKKKTPRKSLLGYLLVLPGWQNHQKGALTFTGDSREGMS